MAMSGSDTCRSKPDNPGKTHIRKGLTMVAVPRRVPVRCNAVGPTCQRQRRRSGLRAGNEHRQRHRRLTSATTITTAAEADAFILAATQLTGRHDLGFELGRRQDEPHDLLGYGLMSPTWTWSFW